MQAPGVEIRPLRQMTGGASFNEVFFTDVRVPDDHRLGDVNNGWNVALTTLMNERAAIGGGGGGRRRRPADAGRSRWPRHFGLDRRPDRAPEARRPGRPRPRRCSTRTSGRWTRSRSGQLPGPEMSIAKLASTPATTPPVRVRRRAARPEDHRRHRRVGHVRLVAARCSASPGGRIAGGSDEVMRNIVGERVLGLPKDAGIDSTSPFRDLKVGTQVQG